MIIIRKKKTKKGNNFSFAAVFQIKLHKKDEELLKFLQSYSEAGRIEKRGVNASSLTVSSLKQMIEKILPHFDKYPLKTKKLADYLIWKEIVLKMNSDDHLKKKGIQ